MAGVIELYERIPGLVFGFHGCDKATFENVIYNNEQLKDSDNIYDWLGKGKYFWENSYNRALDWAKYKFPNEPYVIGAVIDLGKCFNLTDYNSSEILKRGYEMLKHNCETSNTPMPKNHAKRGEDVLLRDLDCAVIEQIHDFHRNNHIRGYDTVRGVFIEGDRAFPGSEIMTKTHIQLCVRNPNCIRAYFIPRTSEDGYIIP